MLRSKTYKEVREQLHRTINLLPPLDVNENDFELHLKLQKVLKLVLKQENKAERVERVKSQKQLVLARRKH